MEISQVAPELRERVQRMPPLPLGNAFGRRFFRWLGGLMPAPNIEDVRIEQRSDTAPALRIYQPAQRRSAAALVWIHGGGMIIGQAAQDDRLCATTARTLGICVVSVEYRLAPEHPFPAPLDDCYAAWQWLQQHGAALGVDASRVAVGGESAGGGLAASLAQRLHDEGGSAPIAQWLHYPMLDDRTAAQRQLDALHHFVWNNRLNRIGWRSLLGAEPGGSSVPAYAVAARRADLHGLPPAWIGAGDIDLFFEEDRVYAERLRAAGVDVTFDTVHGAPHGFPSWAPNTAISRDFIARAQAWLAQALEPAP